MKTTRSESGAAHLAVILIIIVLAVIGFAGWRIYQINNKIKVPTSGSLLETKSSPTSTIPEGWAEFNDESLGVKFIYPKTWTLNKLKDLSQVSLKSTSTDVTYESGTEKSTLYLNIASDKLPKTINVGLNNDRQYCSSVPLTNAVLKGLYISTYRDGQSSANKSLVGSAALTPKSCISADIQKVSLDISRDKNNYQVWFGATPVDFKGDVLPNFNAESFSGSTEHANLVKILQSITIL